MHFHLATVFMLVPLLAAAPTPNIEQRADVMDTVKSALEPVTGPLTGGLGNLPTGNAKRQAVDVADALAAALKLAGSKLQSGKRDGIDVIKTVNEILTPVSDFKYPDGSAQKSNDKRNDGIDVIKTANEILTPVSEFKYPDGSAQKSNDKRDDGIDVTKTVDELLKEYLEGIELPPTPAEKRDVIATVAKGVLDEVIDAATKSTKNV
ncbi:hypothetical protein V500_07059 [Pseudogymnoascus sp. VKM F-4518 (FW-2643)]|nr:hypothetical protein V500_07059 [Pseudogymnoascus sp. VKM F-4518 (FW-2643)]